MEYLNIQLHVFYYVFYFGISNCIETSEILYVTTSIQIKFDTSRALYIKMGPIIYEHIRYHFLNIKYMDLHHFGVH